jgi:hypothetical protein
MILRIFKTILNQAAMDAIAHYFSYKHRYCAIGSFPHWKTLLFP